MTSTHNENYSRSDEFITEVVNTLTTYGKKYELDDFRSPVTTMKFFFGQWSLVIKTTAQSFHETDKYALAELHNYGTWENYRFRVTVVRNNPSPLGWSTYSVRRTA